MEQNIIIAGFGGQGVLSAGIILANAIMFEGLNVTWYPCYGAEMRGGAVNCEIVFSENEVSSIHKKEVDFLIALNDLSFKKFLPKLKVDGTVIANSSIIEEECKRNDVHYIFSKISDIARNLGNIKVANIVALGILSSICDNLKSNYVKKAIERALPPEKKYLLNLNLEAFKIGYNYINTPIYI